MLKILGRATSINVRKVLWTCAELGIATAHEPWGTRARPTSDPAFLALNPNGLAPVLQDGDFTLWESNAICRYLEDAYGRGALLPRDVRARAVVEQWMDWQATELNNAWRYAFMALVRHSPQHGDPVALAASVASWNRHMAILDGRLRETGAFVGGDDFSLADVVLGLSTNRWCMTPMERPSLPAVERYYERLSERPAFLLHGRNGVP